MIITNMATNPSIRLQRKLNKQLEDKDFLENDIPNFNDNSDLFFDDSGEMERIGEEDELNVDISNEIVDTDFLSKISNKTTKLSELMEKNTPKSNSGEHPMDAYLKKLILEVLVNDFLPILEKKLS